MIRGKSFCEMQLASSDDEYIYIFDLATQIKWSLET